MMRGRNWIYLISGVGILALAVLNIVHQAGRIGERNSHPETGRSTLEEHDKIPMISYELANGARVYDRYCKVCHGETGEGDGFNAFNLDPKPQNFKDPEWQRVTTDQDLRTAIAEGGPALRRSVLMPAWGRVLGRRQSGHVLKYVRSLGQPSPAG